MSAKFLGRDYVEIYCTESPDEGKCKVGKADKGATLQPHWQQGKISTVRKPQAGKVRERERILLIWDLRVTGLPAPPSPWTWRVYQSDAGAALPVSLRVSQYDVCPSLISDLCISISVIFITYLNLGSHSLWPFDIIIAREEAAQMTAI